MNIINIVRSIIIIFSLVIIFLVFGSRHAYSQCNTLCMHERNFSGLEDSGTPPIDESGLMLGPSYEVAINDSSNNAEGLKDNSILLADNSTGTDISISHPASDRWHFSIIPYLWAAATSGKVGIGPFTANVNQSFSNTMTNFDFGLQLHLEASKDNYGFFFDGNYSKYSQGRGHTLPGPGQNKISVDSTSKFFLGELGGFYRVGVWSLNNTPESKPKSTLTLDLIGGGRLWYLKNELDFTGPLGVNPNVSKSKSWFDFFIGSRARLDINKFFILIRSDVGGFDLGFSSTISWNIEGYIGYELPWWGITPIIGYRALYDNYDTGSGKSFFKWDGWMYGPVIGLGFQF